MKILGEYGSEKISWMDYSNTLVNIATILSGMKKHNSAFKYVTEAVETVKQNYRKDFKENEFAMMCIASYNQGVELEHLGKIRKAIKIYEDTLEYAAKNLKAGHRLIGLLGDTLEKAKKINEKQTMNHTIRYKKREKNSISVIQGNTIDVNNEILSFAKNISNLKTSLPVIEVHNKSYIKRLMKLRQSFTKENKSAVSFY